MGVMNFSSAEEAIEYGQQLLKHIFPAIKYEIKLEDLELTECPKPPE